jgi:predicted O-methyltransferase YrrM
LGLATSAISLGNPKAQITTLEGCPETSKNCPRAIRKFGLTNVEFVVSEFRSYLEKANTSTQHFSLIYFDGNHQKQATLDYFDLLLPTITMIRYGLMIYTGLQEWRSLGNDKKHPKVTVTIDTFQWGLFVLGMNNQRNILP